MIVQSPEYEFAMPAVAPYTRQEKGRGEQRGKKGKSKAGLAWAEGEDRARTEGEGRDTTGVGAKPKEGRKLEGREGGRGTRGE